MMQEIYMHFGVSFGIIAVMLAVLVIACIKTNATDRPDLRQEEKGDINNE